MKKNRSQPLDISHREQIADLEKTPGMFRQVLNASGVAMSIRNKNLRPIYVNQAFTDFYGYTAEELCGTSLEDIVPEKTLNLYMTEVYPTVASGESWEGEYTIRTKAGRLCGVWGRFDPVFDAEGNVTNSISIMRDASASMRMRSALEQTERHLTFLSRNTSDCLFRLRLTDWRYDYISSAIESIVGHAPQEFYDNPDLFRQLVPEDWQTTYQKWWDEFARGESRYEYESPIIHKDGSRRWLHQRITLEHGDNGKPVAIEGILTDATSRKKAENALKRNEEKYRFLAENITDVVWTLDNDSNFTYATPSVINLWGYTPEELYALEFDSLFTSESLKEIAEAHKLRVEAEARGDYDHVNRTEVEHYHKDGSTVWAESFIRRIYDENHNPIGYQGISRNVTERKRAEEALIESERKYRLLIEAIEDVIWTMDNDFNYTYVSPSIEQLLGYRPEEYLRIDLSETMTPESMATVKEMRRRLRTEADAESDMEFVNRFEIERVHKNGTTTWVESIIRRQLSYEGEAIGYLGISRDITPRKEAELAIKEREARFRTLFEDSPISLWEEDLTRLKAYFDELKEQGVEDFRQYFYDNPEELGKCATLVDVVDVNKATLELLRARSREELLGNLDKVLTESSMAAFTEEMILLASGGCEYCGEITHRTLEGDIIWVVVNFTVPPEHTNTLSRVIVSLIDVTPRKRAEEALMESEERYRVLVENAQEGVVVSENGAPLFINEAMTEIFGFNNEELKRVHPLELSHPSDKDRAMKDLADFTSGKKREAFTSFRAQTQKGEVKWLTMTVKPITWGGEDARLEIFTDITAHKSLEEELRVAHAEMEHRVEQRTAELSKANLRLTEEVLEREKAQEQILTLTQQLIRIQEDERQRIARDLHDNVAQDLSSIVLNLETLFDGHSIIEPQVLERGSAIGNIVRRAIASVRDIAYGLRPPALDQLGLSLALQRQCEEAVDRTAIDIDFFAVGIENLKLDYDSEINIYRMVQEAINNIAKHAKADKATVRLIKSHPDLIVRVEDNGRGFEVDKRLHEAVEEQRMGLRSMEERARLIGGSMEIQSLVNTGTRIIFKIPITDARRQ